jgi:hypothetical protein
MFHNHIGQLHYLQAILQSCVFCFKGYGIFLTTGQVGQWHLTVDHKKLSTTGSKRIRRSSMGIMFKIKDLNVQTISYVNIVLVSLKFKNTNLLITMN